MSNNQFIFSDSFRFIQKFGGEKFWTLYNNPSTIRKDEKELSDSIKTVGDIVDREVKSLLREIENKIKPKFEKKLKLGAFHRSRRGWFFEWRIIGRSKGPLLTPNSAKIYIGIMASWDKTEKLNLYSYIYCSRKNKVADLLLHWGNKVDSTVNKKVFEDMYVREYLIIVGSQEIDNSCDPSNTSKVFFDRLGKIIDKNDWINKINK